MKARLQWPDGGYFDADLDAVPAEGDLLDYGGKLWRVRERVWVAVDVEGGLAVTLHVGEYPNANLPADGVELGEPVDARR